jgi:phosphoserine aminotransferase
MQGGATGQFSAIPMNLMNLKEKNSADYVVTGYWSQKAAEEAKKYGNVNLVLSKSSNLNGIPSKTEWNLDPNASYVYYCCNETISGIEFNCVPDCGDVPLVCDASSNFLSKVLDISKFGCIFASAQKNMGPAGLTVVIIRDDLLGYQLSYTPAIFDYKILAKNNSLYNTPPTYAIYISGLIFEWIKSKGGLECIQASNQRKASSLYETIDSSNGFYSSTIQIENRSRVNVTFRIKKDGVLDENLEKKFISEADKRFLMRELKGHRSVGGIRVSLYNAITEDHVKTLVQFMKEFQVEQLQ